MRLALIWHDQVELLSRDAPPGATVTCASSRPRRVPVVSAGVGRGCVVRLRGDEMGGAEDVTATVTVRLQGDARSHTAQVNPEP